MAKIKIILTLCFLNIIFSLNAQIIPTLRINDSSTNSISLAYRIAIGDIFSNIQHTKRGELKTEKSTFFAGFVYDKPWTRDAAINTWNGAGLLFPVVAKNTLIAQLTEEDGQLEIDGQYWDKIILSIGIWNYYLFTGDKEFLKYAYPAIVNSIRKSEKQEFNAKMNLFRGPAVYGDGVSAYPDIYAFSVGYNYDKKLIDTDEYTAIYRWPDLHPDLKEKIGYGLPMMSLSTNAVYYQAYIILDKIEKCLSLKTKNNWIVKANNLKEAIQKRMWNNEKKSFYYLLDNFGNCDKQEGMRLSFVLLFDIASESQKKCILDNTIITPHGISVLYPTFNRYRKSGIDSYGRHSGTVWPHVEGFWADASLKQGSYSHFEKEFQNLTNSALRDKMFMEIYHPITGLPYGGLQEPTSDEGKEWFDSQRQTWSASAYIRMILYDICGLKFTEKGIYFKPYMAEKINKIEFIDLTYRNSIISLTVLGKGNIVSSFKINGKRYPESFLPYNSVGKQKIEITMSE